MPVIPWIFIAGFGLAVLTTVVSGTALLVNKVMGKEGHDTNVPKVELRAEAEPTPRHAAQLSKSQVQG